MRKLLLITCVLGFALPHPVAADTPKVLASIGPVHSLVSAVMDGVGEPGLIVRRGQSPHTYTLRPSDARALQDAELVFWIGPGLEAVLQRPLKQLAKRARIIELGKARELHVLNLREHSRRGIQAYASGRSPSRDDPHIWLLPRNAIVITNQAALHLGKVFPRHRERFSANAHKTVARLREMESRLRRQLSGAGEKRFAVFHDAFQYFEQAFGLTAPIVINPSPEGRPGAARVRKIRAALVKDNVRCVFLEPQLNSRQLAVYIGNGGINAATLDPLGSNFPPGRNHYFATMGAIADNMTSCFSR